MDETSLIIVPQEIPKHKSKLLYDEFKYAWGRASNDDKKAWAIDTAKLFGKVTVRRGRGLFNTIRSIIRGIMSEGASLGVSIYKGDVKKHLTDRSEKIKNFIVSGAQKSKKISSNIYKLLKTNPKQMGPIIFLGVLGFFTGAGTDIGEKTFYDIDGGIPDLDWKVGEMTNVDILGHRSPFFHSVISAAVLETLVFSSVNAINIIHSKLPPNHDPFWDKVISKNDWAKAFVTGACTGIAYHLLIDGTLDGGGSLHGLPWSMSRESHQTFFVMNAAAEAIDLDKKDIEKV